jgi:phage terminase large subunit-like protein
MGDDRLVDFPQSFQGMSAPAKELEKLLVQRKIRHGGNPVLRWMASNVALKFGPDGQVKPDRERSKDKIDGIVALVMALGRATVAPAERGSVYEDRGMVVI